MTVPDLVFLHKIDLHTDRVTCYALPYSINGWGI